MINRRNVLMGATIAVAAGASAIPAAAGSDKKVAATGSFTGLSNHVTSGSVKIIQKDGRTFVELGKDFSLDGGPDPRVAFGKDGEYAADTKLGALLNLTGKQRYAVPPSISAADYNEVYIWCEVAGVPLGVAKLK